MTTPTIVTVPPAGVYRLDTDRSTIHFTTRHMFGLGKVTGSFEPTGGRLVIAEPVTASTVTATASAAGFASGNAGRDRTVKSPTYLDAEQYPEISFRSTEVRDTAAGWVLAGLLTVRGNEAPAEFLVTGATTEGLTLTVAATGRIDRYAHGLTAMKGVTGRYLDMEITAVADRV